MYLGDGEHEIGPLQPETVIEAFRLCGHDHDLGEGGLVVIYSKDRLTWYPLYPDPQDNDSIAPEWLWYCIQRVKADIFAFVRRVLEITEGHSLSSGTDGDAAEAPK